MSNLSERGPVSARAAVRAIWDSWEGGTVLDFRGDFYRHTLMIPAFDPGPNPYGAPPVFIGGFGPRMIEVAGEVADGLIVHPFNTRRSLEEIVLPADHQWANVMGAFARAVLTGGDLRSQDEGTLRQAALMERVLAAARIVRF